jgi:hypothetical protein
MSANRRLAGVVVLVAIGSASCGSRHEGVNDKATGPHQPAAVNLHAVFAPGEGWQTRLTSTADSPVAWAANVDFSVSDAAQEFPRNTIDALPSGGIVLVAVGPRPFQGEADFPHLSLPLRLTDGRLASGSYEGQPAPGLSYFYADAWVDDQLLNLWGYLAENPPGTTIRAEADRVLATLRFEGQRHIGSG